MSDTPVFDELLTETPEGHAIFDLDPAAVLLVEEDSSAILSTVLDTETENGEDE